MTEEKKVADKKMLLLLLSGLFMILTGFSAEWHHGAKSNAPPQVPKTAIGPGAPLILENALETNAYFRLLYLPRYGEITYLLPGDNDKDLP